MLRFKKVINWVLFLFFALSVNAFTAEFTEEQISEMAANAEKTVREAFDFLWEYRLKYDMADTLRDPGKTGVIGIEYSPITTTNGYVDSKILSTQPGWASWIVRDLARRGIWPRADIAVSFSGSFPAINIAVLAALQELNCDVKGVCSVGASSWGANEPGMTYPEMERLLREEGIFQIGCSAVTLGGTSDKGAEFDDYAMKIAMEAVKRSRLPFQKPINLRDAIKKRMIFYGDPAEYACFINVGGGHPTMGGGAHLRFDHGGWYYEPLRLKGDPNGVLDRFLDKEVPVLNFLYLEELNEKYNIISQ